VTAGTKSADLAPAPAKDEALPAKAPGPKGSDENEAERDETQRAIDAGLTWLADHQEGDGSWSFNGFSAHCHGTGEPCGGNGETRSDAAGTAMGLLPFLNAGATHQKEGPYKVAVLRGVRRLVLLQNPKTGALIGNSGGGPRMYAHGLAAIALCEAYRLTKDPELEAPAQRAIEFIEKSQHPDQGGWRYYIVGETPTGGDTSVFGWQVRALASGWTSGLTVAPKTLERASVYLKLASTGDEHGLFCYEPKGQVSSAMTAVGLLSQKTLGKLTDEALSEGADYLLTQPPGKHRRDCYFEFYASRSMQQASAERRDRWNGILRPYLLRMQEQKGCARGSWSPTSPVADRWGQTGGRVMVTAFSLLSLEECQPPR